MSKIERGHLLSREPLNAMSEGENAKTARVLRDDELDAVSGGKVQMQDVHFARLLPIGPDNDLNVIGANRQQRIIVDDIGYW